MVTAAALIGFACGAYGVILAQLVWPKLRAYSASRPAAKLKESKRRRERYELLKAAISERHFAGYAGLICDFDDWEPDAIDMASFRAPMYGTVKNANMRWCIFWDRDRMTREIGVGAPLKEGETIAAPADPVHAHRPQLWQKTPDEVDEQQALTHRKEPADGEAEDL